MKNIESGNYHIASTSTTHNQLLLRKHDEINRKNFDLLFENVHLIYIPFRFDLISIEAVELNNSYEFKLNCIDSQKYFIRAKKLLFQSNKLAFSDSSIPSDLEKPIGKDFYLELSKLSPEEVTNKLRSISSSENNWNNFFD